MTCGNDVERRLGDLNLLKRLFLGKFATVKRPPLQRDRVHSTRLQRARGSPWRVAPRLRDCDPRRILRCQRTPATPPDHNSGRTVGQLCQKNTRRSRIIFPLCEYLPGQAHATAAPTAVREPLDLAGVLSWMISNDTSACTAAHFIAKVRGRRRVRSERGLPSSGCRLACLGEPR